MTNIEKLREAAIEAIEKRKVTGTADEILLACVIERADTYIEAYGIASGKCFKQARDELFADAADRDAARRKAPNLSDIPTRDLVFELRKREGVEEIIAEPYEPYRVCTKRKQVRDEGPAILLVVTD